MNMFHDTHGISLPPQVSETESEMKTNCWYHISHIHIYGQGLKSLKRWLFFI